MFDGIQNSTFTELNGKRDSITDYGLYIKRQTERIVPHKKDSLIVRPGRTDPKHAPRVL